MRTFIIRALLLSVGTILGALAVAGIVSASGPLMPIAVTWPTSGQVTVGEAVTIEANCPVLTVVNGSPVFDSIVTLKLGAKVLWHQPRHIKQNTSPCVQVGGGACAWPNTGVCVGPVLTQTPAVFEVVVPSGAVSGEITAIDGYGSVIAEGKVTVFGSTPAKPTVPTGTTPTSPKTSTHTTTTTTKPAKPTSPKTTTTHVPSPTHLPWWRSLWRRVLSWF